MSSLLLARTITVDDDGPADFQSIQAAIDDPNTVAGDEVSVAPGTYFENLVLKCGVSVVGGGSETTTVDGGETGPVAAISGCGSDTRLEGFKLTNGRSNSGGGVSVAGGAPVITLNRITGNLAQQSGGGAWLYNTSATVSQNLITSNVSSGSGGGISANQDRKLPMARPLITRNQVSENQALGGAGIQIDSTDAIVTNNLITGNRASNGGGGMSVNGGGIGYYCYYGCYPYTFPTLSITNNTIAGNLCGSGGGLHLSGDIAGVANNVIYNNRASVGGGGMNLDGSLNLLERNIFFLNSPDDCSASQCTSSGNLISDPLLLNPAAADYRLGAGSPAIDSGLATGAPPDDLRGQRRPLDGNFDGLQGIDRGAFEYDGDELLGLRFVSKSVLNWDAVPGVTSYHVYSGHLGTFWSGGLDTCRDNEDTDRSDLAFTETLTPAEGTGLAYVVTAVVGGVETSPAWKVQGFETELAVQCPRGSSGCIEPAAGLISWWPADGNANDIQDVNDGTLLGGTTFAPGMVEQAFSFNGASRVSAPTAGLPIGNSNRTLELWVKVNNFIAGEAFFAGYGTFGSFGQTYHLGTSSNILFFSQWGQAVFGPALETGRWYHVAVTNVGNSVTLYLDGAAVASGSLSIQTPSGTQLFVGSLPGDTFRRLDGLIDEVGIYDRAIPSTEIQAIFFAGSAGKCKAASASINIKPSDVVSPGS